MEEERVRLDLAHDLAVAAGVVVVAAAAAGVVVEELLEHDD